MAADVSPRVNGCGATRCTVVLPSTESPLLLDKKNNGSFDQIP